MARSILAHCLHSLSQAFRSSGVDSGSDRFADGGGGLSVTDEEVHALTEEVHSRRPRLLNVSARIGRSATRRSTSMLGAGRLTTEQFGRQYNEVRPLGSAEPNRLEESYAAFRVDERRRPSKVIVA